MQLWNADQVAQFLNVKPRTVLEKFRNNPKFPKPYKINGRVVRWDADEIISFIKSSR